MRRCRASAGVRCLMIGVVGLLLATACGKSPRAATYWSQIQDLGAWMTGSFRCEAPRGLEGATRTVRLDIIEFWPRWNDSGVLYAEWAHEDALGEPLRQEVFHVQRFPDGSAALVVFDLRDPARYAGAWRDPKRLGTLKGDGLIERPARTLRLERETAERYTGATLGADDAGAMLAAAAAYDVAGLEISPERLAWVPSGLDDDGWPVPGDPADGDVYVKIANRAFR